MKIRLLRGLYVEGRTVPPGTELDLDRRSAARIVSAGKAEALEPWPPKDPTWARSTAPREPEQPAPPEPEQPAPPANPELADGEAPPPRRGRRREG